MGDTDPAIRLGTLPNIDNFGRRLESGSSIEGGNTYSTLKQRILMNKEGTNREGTGKGVAWVKSNFGSKRASVIIDQAEKFLENMNFRVIGKGCLK